MRRRHRAEDKKRKMLAWKWMSRTWRWCLHCISPRRKHNTHPRSWLFSLYRPSARKRSLSIRQRPRTKHPCLHKSSPISERNLSPSGVRPTLSVKWISTKRFIMPARMAFVIIKILWWMERKVLHRTKSVAVIPCVECMTLGTIFESSRMIFINFLNLFRSRHRHQHQERRINKSAFFYLSATTCGTFKSLSIKFLNIENRAWWS